MPAARSRMGRTRRMGRAKRNPSSSWLIAAATTITALLLAGCGERPQDIAYKQGVYQGKPDTRAWDNPPFKGDQKAWELALKDRAQSQNEYKRTN